MASFWAAGATGMNQVASSPVHVFSLDVGRDLDLPLVPIVEQLLFAVQQLMCLGGELKVGVRHDGIDMAGLLSETAVDTLGHVDVVAL